MLSLFVLQTICNAQFTPSGSEPSSIKWSEIQTPTYKLIYPNGLDSLARLYARSLESAVEPVSGTIGIKPNQSYQQPLPVVLRTRTSYSNGMVSWAPKRMELMTLPSVNEPEATPWHVHLALHESRHLAQMQYFAIKPFSWANVLSGQLIAGGLDFILCGRWMTEGDAVVTETALSSVGRGRTADFLEYYRVSFAEGQMRDYYRWAFLSQRRYTPNHYHSGYLLYSGIRALYDKPEFVTDFHNYIIDSKRLSINPKGDLMKAISGKHRDDLFAEICDTLRLEWHKDELARGPFMPKDTLVANYKHFTEFTGLGFMGIAKLAQNENSLDSAQSQAAAVNPLNSAQSQTAATKNSRSSQAAVSPRASQTPSLFAVRQGLTLPSELVKVDPNGRVRPIAKLSYYCSSPQFSQPSQRIFWSDYASDLRWDLQTYSNICYYDGRGRHNLTRNQRYFNPSPNQIRPVIAVVEFAIPDGKASILVLDALSGEVLESHPCPNEIQPVEPVWQGDELYFSGITDDGFSIYSVSDFSPQFLPTKAKIKQLREDVSGILFVCDRTSVNELYSLNPQSKTILQLSNTPQGAADFSFSPSRDTLYYSSLGVDGRKICFTPSDQLPIREVDFASNASYPFADKLSQGEPKPFVLRDDIPISEPRSYSKFENLLQIHSWLPVYFDYDAISSLSFSSIGSSANVGATAFFQNELGNAYASVAFKALSDDFKWRPSAHINFHYDGLFPVFELKAHFNERNSLYYLYRNLNSGPSFTSSRTTIPYFSANAQVYLPLSFTSAGWNRGLIPSASINIGNDFFSDGNKSILMSRAAISLRGYSMESIPNSRIFPRWGLGMEIGKSFRPGLSSVIQSNNYLLGYAYLPGIWQTHGLKISALHESKTGKGLFCESYANTMPRGYDSNVLGVLSSFPSQTKFTADYAMPVFAVDWSIFKGFMIIRNFELTPHFDYSILKSDMQTGNLYSAGFDFSARFLSLLSIILDMKLGVSVEYLGGKYFNPLKQLGAIDKPYHIGMKFSTNF